MPAVQNKSALLVKSQLPRPMLGKVVKSRTLTSSNAAEIKKGLKNAVNKSIKFAEDVIDKENAMVALPDSHQKNSNHRKRPEKITTATNVVASKKFQSTYAISKKSKPARKETAIADFVQQNENLVNFQPDPAALQSILTNRGISSCVARPSIYIQTNRLSAKPAANLDQIMQKFVKGVERQFLSASSNVDCPPPGTVTGKHTPVRLSIYGRSSMITNHFQLKTPSSSIKPSTVTRSQQIVPFGLVVPKIAICSPEISNKFVEQVPQLQLENHELTKISSKHDEVHTVTPAPETPSVELERQLSSLDTDELRKELVRVTKKKNLIEKCLASKQALFTERNSNNGSRAPPIPSVVSKNALPSIRESTESDGTCNSQKSATACEKRLSAFSPYGQQQQLMSDEYSTKFTIHTPKPKRRVEESDADGHAARRLSLTEMLLVSPMCDTKLIEIEPPMKTPMLLRSVSMRARHEQKTKANSPSCLRNSSPNADSSTTTDQSKNSEDVVLSPILSSGNLKTSSLTAVCRYLGSMLDDASSVDLACDSEVARLTEKNAKRIKLSMDHVRVLDQPVAFTLTFGDDTCFLPIAASCCDYE